MVYDLTKDLRDLPSRAQAIATRGYARTRLTT